MISSSGIGIALTDLPLPLRRRAVPDERGGDRALRRQHQRVAPGLADAHDGDLRLIHLRQRGELRDRGLEIAAPPRGRSCRSRHRRGEAPPDRDACGRNPARCRRSRRAQSAPPGPGCAAPNRSARASARWRGPRPSVAGSARNAGSPPAQWMVVGGDFRHARSLEHDAGIAQVLVAVDQVDLPDLDFPASVALDEAVAAPARQEARAVDAELADQVSSSAPCAPRPAWRRTPRHSRPCARCAISAPATRHSRCAGGRCGPPCGGDRRTRSRSRAADRRPRAFPAPNRRIPANTSRAIRRTGAGRAGALPAR